MFFIATADEEGRPRADRAFTRANGGRRIVRSS